MTKPDYITNLLPDEYRWITGRSAYFTVEPQPFPVERTRKITSGCDLRRWCDETIDWIGIQIRHPWTFDIHITHIHEAKVRFEFSTSTDAVLFALAWR